LKIYWGKKKEKKEGKRGTGWKRNAGEALSGGRKKL